MKLIMLILSLTFLVSSCQNNSTPVTQTPAPAPAPASTVAVETPVVVAPALKPYLTVTACTNCTPDEWQFIQDGTAKLNETVDSSCFQSKVLAFQFLKGWTLGRNNQQVFDSLHGADVKIQTEMYYTYKRVLGYTLPDAMKEWLNRRTMVGWNRCDLSSLLGHETSHKVGYDHTFNYTTGRENSVPYGLNTIVDACCDRSKPQ
jgi:hypothetical protein